MFNFSTEQPICIKESVVKSCEKKLPVATNVRADYLPKSIEWFAFTIPNIQESVVSALIMNADLKFLLPYLVYLIWNAE